MRKSKTNQFKLMECKVVMTEDHFREQVYTRGYSTYKYVYK